MGKKYAPPQPTKESAWGSVVSSPSGVRSEALEENEFGALLTSQNISGETIV